MLLILFVIFMIISSREYLINGFNNKNIRRKYFSEDSENPRNINKMTRTLSKLRAHGIIKKVSKKNKYYLTTTGRKLISSILIYTRKELIN